LSFGEVQLHGPMLFKLLADEPGYAIDKGQERQNTSAMQLPE
jgi:hypothetical protein